MKVVAVKIQSQGGASSIQRLQGQLGNVLGSSLDRNLRKKTRILIAVHVRIAREDGHEIVAHALKRNYIRLLLFTSVSSESSRTTQEGCNCQFRKALCTEGGHKVQGSVDPTFAEGLPFLVSKKLELKAFRDSGNSFQIKFRDVPDFWETPERTPETATAFSSFLNQFEVCLAVVYLHQVAGID